MRIRGEFHRHGEPLPLPSADPFGDLIADYFHPDREET